jgi:glycosyltransferase involved in cell wall biosynthesis
MNLGVAADRVRVLRNGVDLEQFRPRARERQRGSGPTLLSVGHLVGSKGHDLVVRALARLPAYRLIIAGDGPERSRYEGLARQLGVADRVTFLGSVPHRDLAEVYSAADALVLASAREGWPNVILEALACGTPVIGSRVGGIPEIITVPESGVLLDETTSEGVVRAVLRLFSHLPERNATRSYAERFSWDATNRGQLQLFSDILLSSTATQDRR